METERKTENVRTKRRIEIQLKNMVCRKKGQYRQREK